MHRNRFEPCENTGEDERCMLSEFFELLGLFVTGALVRFLFEFTRRPGAAICVLDCRPADLDLLSHLQDLCVATAIDVRGCQIAQAFVRTVVVGIDESADLAFRSPGGLTRPQWGHDRVSYPGFANGAARRACDSCLCLQDISDVVLPDPAFLSNGVTQPADIRSLGY